MENTRIWVGMDVHKEQIAVCVVGDSKGEILDRFEVLHTGRGVDRLARRVVQLGDPRCVYEAGSCGYELQRTLSSKGMACEVVAPSLIPKKAGDRVKTDPRDAEKLARVYRLGELTPIAIPTPEQEAARDLVRSREDAHQDLVRHRHRLSKFLLRHGRRWEGKKAWTSAYWEWIRSQRFEDLPGQLTMSEYVLAVEQGEERVGRLTAHVEEASRQPALAPFVERLRTLRGVKTVTAMTLVTELLDWRRFPTARSMMGFLGLTPREHSSGSREIRGPITKTGNAHLRRVLVEAAWQYRFLPSVPGSSIWKRRQGHPPWVVEIARKAEIRLHKKFLRMIGRGKRRTVAAVAVARELVGFVWALGQRG